MLNHLLRNFNYKSVRKSGKKSEIERVTESEIERVNKSERK